MIAFAITGALIALRKQMDIVGFVVLGTVTGIGGGTLRDLLLGLPVFWVRQPDYLIACALVSALIFFAAHIPRSRYRLLLWFDAVGLAIFAVTGAERALQAGAGFVTAIAMGMITATFGAGHPEPGDLRHRGVDERSGVHRPDDARRVARNRRCSRLCNWTTHSARSAALWLVASTILAGVGRGRSAAMNGSWQA